MRRKMSTRSTNRTAAFFTKHSVLSKKYPISFCFDKNTTRSMLQPLMKMFGKRRLNRVGISLIKASFHPQAASPKNSPRRSKKGATTKKRSRSPHPAAKETQN